MPRLLIRDAYDQYLALTDTTPSNAPHTEDEIKTVILAAGLRYEQADSRFWNRVSDEWFWGEHHRRPFRDEPDANREYARLANERGLR